MTRTPGIAIAAEQEAPPLSAAQQAFNDLVRQIEERRRRLTAWEAAALPYQEKYVGRLLPLVDTWLALQTRLVECLDLAGERLGKAERSALSGVVAGLAEELLDHRENPAVRAIHDRHRPPVQHHREHVPPAAAPPGPEETGETDSPEAILERVEAQLEADRQARETHRAARRRSARKTATETQRQLEDQQASRSIREVYRKLASILHPDRESDPDERQRKTVLMQRANRAWEKKNLLELLELQLESEHLDRAAMARPDPARLPHYSRVLREQLAELDKEVARAEGSFRARFGISPLVKLSPATAARQLSGDIAGLQQLIRDLQRKLLAFADIDNVREWLKRMR